MRRKKFIDCILFVGAPFFLAIFLTGLSGHWGNWDSGIGSIGWGMGERLGIALGVALICFGFLRKYWEKSLTKMP